DGLLALVEPSRDPETAPVGGRVGEGEPVALSRPRCPPRPVAGRDRPPLAARVDPVEGGANGPQDRGLAGLVLTQEHGDPWGEVETDVAEASEPDQLQPLQPHRSPTSTPLKACRP